MPSTSMGSMVVSGSEDEVSDPKCSKEDVRDESKSQKRKRKVARVSRPQGSVKRIRGHGSITQYNAVWKMMLEDDMKLKRIDRGNAVTQIGMSLWSTTEREKALIEHRSAYHIHCVPHVAPLESKSELETRQYLLRVAGAKDELDPDEGNEPSITYKDLPTSAEIGLGCCEAIEVAAAASVRRDLKEDATVEQKEFGDHWLLTRSSLAGFADDVHDSHEEESLVSQEEHIATEPTKQRQQKTPIPGNIEQALDLFRLPIWLELSERIFMNSGVPAISENWRSIAVDDERPGMFASALQSFYTIIINFVRRVVAATIFQAQSRLRNTGKQTGESRQGRVRGRDVITALSFMDLSIDKFQFWVKAPRRNGLRLGAVDADELLALDMSCGRDSPEFLDEDDAEYELQHEYGMPLQPFKFCGPTKESFTSGMDESDEDATIDKADDDAEYRALLQTQNSLLDEADNELELFDQAASMNEEDQLRCILKMDPVKSDHDSQFDNDLLDEAALEQPDLGIGYSTPIPAWLRYGYAPLSRQQNNDFTACSLDVFNKEGNQTDMDLIITDSSSAAISAREDESSSGSNQNPSSRTTLAVMRGKFSNLKEAAPRLQAEQQQQQTSRMSSLRPRDKARVSAQRNIPTQFDYSNEDTYDHEIGHTRGSRSYRNDDNDNDDDDNNDDYDDNDDDHDHDDIGDDYGNCDCDRNGDEGSR